MRDGSFGRRHSRTVSVLAAAAGVAALFTVAGQADPDPDRTMPRTASPTPSPAEPPAEPLAAEASEARTPAPIPAQERLRANVVRASRITDSVEWASFTVLDRTVGGGLGDSRQAEVTKTESTVKTWLAADLLHQRGGRPDSWEQTLIDLMIRSSDDDAAQVVWRSLGGDESIRRMIRVCRMTDTRVYPGWWSLTQISSRDLVRLGTCILPGPGRYLSADESGQLLALMRSVDPSNAFGIPEAEPAGPGVRVAVKNGWTEHGGTGLWNVNCLGIWGPGNRYVLAVTTRYPIGKGLYYGADVCRRVTATLFP